MIKESRVEKVTDVVKAVLEEQPKTRDNDQMLICIVYKRFGFDWKKPFCDIMYSVSVGQLPSFESITRARRKCQELYPELRASEKVEEARLENTKNYVELSQARAI